MEIAAPLIFLVVGMAAGFAGAWLIYRNVATTAAERAKSENESECVRLRTQLDELNKRAQDYVAHNKEKDDRLDSLGAKLTVLERREAELIATLQAEKEATEAKLALVEDARRQLADVFSALSKEALDQNSQSFVNYAQSILDGYQRSAQEDLRQRQERISDLVAPVRDSLEKVDERIQQLERERAGAYGELRQQVTQMAATQETLRNETANLVRALRSSNTRGQWGEIQLRRVVELAGMTNYCDFQEQASAETEVGRHRPDMIINLPGGRTIVVDAKAPMAGFLDAHEATEEAVRRDCLVRHAQQLRAHIGVLSQKAYWNSFKPSPEFVLLFLPNEALFSVALEHDPRLIEDGAANNVIIATPTTLIALLKAAAYGWKQEAIAREVQQVGDLGRELYERLGKLTEHIVTLGTSINKSVQSYNAMIGSIERRVLVTGRRFKALNVTGDSSGDIPELLPIEAVTRELQEPEMRPVLSDAPPEGEIEASDEDVLSMPAVASVKIR